MVVHVLELASAILALLALIGSVAACATVVVNRLPGVTLHDPWHACFLLSPTKLTTRGLTARRVAICFIVATHTLAGIFAILVATHHH